MGGAGRSNLQLTVSVLVSDVDVAIFESGAFFGIFVALDFGDERRLPRFFVT